MRRTNLNEIKETAKALLLAVEIENVQGMPICNHPFTNTTVYVPNYTNFNDHYDLTTKEGFEVWSKNMFNVIDKGKNFLDIYKLVLAPWRLTLLKFCEPNMNERLFTEYFADAWVGAENPNMDANCSLKLFVKWFRQGKPEWLMQKEDLKVYNELPEKFEVYRGVAVGRNPNGLSWTRDYETAKWFSERFNRNGKKGYMQKALIDKKDALAYFNTRGENEIVVDSISIKNNIVIMQ